MRREPYRYVRFTWMRRFEMEELEREFKDLFRIRRLKVPTGERDITPSPYEREGLSVEADTLKARLAPMRAVLFQREPTPFTGKDIELRRRIMELYPRNRASPLTLGVLTEPDFEVKNEKIKEPNPYFSGSITLR